MARLWPRQPVDYLRRMQCLPLRLSLALSLAASALGCGDDGGAGDTDGGTDASSTGAGVSTDPASSSSTATDTTVPGSSSTADPSTTAADTSSTSGSSESSGETAGETSKGSCQVWEITYDLAGSEFEISETPFGAGDQVNVLQEPYDAGGNIGPGSFVLQFEDIDGAPGGLATMNSYQMVLGFVVGGMVTVTTDIEGQAGPAECGITQGLLNAGTVAWAPPQIVDYVTTGTVLCEGALCSAGGLPNGKAVDQSGTSNQPITDFVFEDDLSGFTMAEIVVGMENSSVNSWLYVGTETGRELVDAPDCLCQ